MLLFVVISFQLFSKVEAEKKKNKLTSDSLRVQLDSNLVLQKKSDSLTNLLSNLLASHPITTKEDSSAQVLIYDLKNISQSSAKLNDSRAYEKAMQLEKEAFTALTNNDFETALNKFTEIEKVSPSFHMAYEISRLLKKNRSNFSDKTTQLQIKNEIITKYSWRAPADQLKELKKQTAQ